MFENKFVSDGKESPVYTNKRGWRSTPSNITRWESGIYTPLVIWQNRDTRVKRQRMTCVSTQRSAG